MKNHQSNTGPEVPIPQERSEPARLINSQGSSPFLLVCEHASCFIPPEFESLGLPPELRTAHIAWDPGALAVAQRLSRTLDARLVAATVSRLVYDCNRPPTAQDAMPRKSEVYDIPGNLNLTQHGREQRIQDYYEPFQALLTETLATTKSTSSVPVMATIHSFSPVYREQQRTTEIGILHDSDTRFADTLLQLAPQHSPLKFRRNDPYGPADGVTHTLQAHGLKTGVMNVMIEIRNDLIRTQVQQDAMAAMLAGLLLATWKALTTRVPRKEGI
ncbi:MAG: N-formylglutamate amidohydrolase [Marinobacter sp.]|uniref:N-formylglutamate amidohydrolase n=1 Tax=Marinobacter sp. TaxID=50741 RepID=UPI00349FF562